ncbi:MAG: N-acetylmuramoyl-L-alanine amidase [Gemmatimonadetes bacterium]|nr:N-acetylmuramoyl-L-alanine amidase [Gemmatimonadota bacterium]MCA9762348.1 N-acetylmuramoyl-L-alanine amidase [Gemmatimonadota bacterium]MCA9767523.1 N-acetylmuramoyl-L-alanine amidase [Gemmatimonadota bacterium]HPF60476.1 N-acetylmuramoyl-L-alanine amidase [Gemmatimonadales bacterium]HRX18472.1 N-acetylmuramoyl-L-alanine amidase [Gemmatimonadales bacterium]
MRLLLAASLVLAWSAPPSVLQVSTRGGVERIALRQDAQHGALVPLAPLARAVGATIEQRPPWVVLTAKSARFRFLAGTPLVADGEEMRPLPAPTVQLGDTTWVPLAFVADVLADPARRAWHWNAANTMLAEGPPVSQLVTRPAPTATPRPATAAGALRPGHVVTIDPGHGGTDPGNDGQAFPSGLKEKDVTLAISLLVRDELQQRGVRVVMTRTTDTLINLSHRAPRYCRDECDLFVSIHVNSLPRRPGWTLVRGFETYFLADARTADAKRTEQMENDAIRYEVPEEEVEVRGLEFMLKDMRVNEYLRESARAAELMQEALGGVHDGTNRGVKQAGFAVLNTARRPAVLVELGFGTNADDARLMTTARGQRALARALADATVEYLRELERKTAPVGGADR